jgi:hypothetical protein
VKVAELTVRATVAQSARWKQAAESEGHGSVGAWLARAAAGYLRAVTVSGRPRPLAWHKTAFRAMLVPAHGAAPLLTEDRPGLQALAAELARLWVRWDGSEPDEAQKAQLLLGSSR